MLVGHYEGGVARAVEDHDSHTVHTWYFGLGTTLFWLSLLLQKLQTRQLLLSAAYQNTGYLENVVMLSRHAAQLNYFRWDKWDGPLKPEFDINSNQIMTIITQLHLFTKTFACKQRYVTLKRHHLVRQPHTLTVISITEILFLIFYVIQVQYMELFLKVN